MKKILILIILLLGVQTANAATVSVKPVGDKDYVCIESNTSVYTVSLSLKNAQDFVYLDEWVVLDVPEYNSSTVKTGGFGGGFTGEECLGYAKKGVLVVDGLILDANNENVYGR